MEEKKEAVKPPVHHEHHEEHHEHHEAKIDNNPDKIDFSKIKKNPWMIISVILAVIAIILLVLIFYKPGTVSGTAAGDNVVKFAQAQGLQASVLGVVDKGAFYEVNLSMNNQRFPVYVTKDGKNMATGLIPLTVDNTNNNTNTNTQTPQEVPKSDKPKVELFVMSYCPYGLQAENGIVPAIEALKGKVDFTVKFVSYAMHGKKEIDENTRQYCIQKDQNNKFLTYLKCFLKDQSSYDKCLTEAKIDKTKLTSCIATADKQFNITANFDNKDSWLNGNYPMYNVDLTLNNKYGVQGSPTLVINSVQADSARDSNSYLKTICGAFNTSPSECSSTIQGTTATAATASAGSCG